MLTYTSACFYGGFFPDDYRERACALLCRQDWYDFTAACFTCIVANGGLTSDGLGVIFPGKDPRDEDEEMDTEYADAAMRNITERCEADFEAVSTPITSFSATPTTT